MQEDDVEAQGTRIFMRRWSDGPGRRILYWHGGGGATEEIQKLAPGLVDAGHRVYSPDAPGYGRSPRLHATGYRPSALAEVALALIDALGIAPVVWIGSSWGASIGIHAAVRGRGQIEALALLDGGYLDPGDDPDFDPSLDLATRTAELRARIAQGESWDAGAEVIAAVMDASDREPPTPLLPGLDAAGIPVLLLRATEPHEYEPIRARALERFARAVPHAEVVTMQGVGHTLLAEAGPQVLRVLLGWLGRPARRSPAPHARG